MHKFHTTADRHDLSPFCHVSRGNINNITVFVTVTYIKTIICKDRTSLYKRSVRKRNSLFVMDKRAENIQKTLHAGADDNIIGRAVYISPLADIVGKHLTQIGFSLWLSIGKETFALAKGAFQIALPQIKAKTFMIDTIGGKVILYRWKIRMAGYR